MTKTNYEILFCELAKSYSLPEVDELKNLFQSNVEFKSCCRFVSAAAYMDPDAVLQEGPGVSYHYRKLENFFPQVKSLCEKTSAIVNKVVNVHAIYTLPESHGFPIHYDFEDVLVYQRSGSKSWKVWKPYRDVITVPSLAHDQKNGLLEQWSKISSSEDYVLRPHDCLFIKAAQPHVAWTAQEHSLHYSFTF